MVNISMKAMLEAGVHFGHQTRRWNPKMARFIFGERNNIHIIDLQKTVKELKKAYAWVKEQAAEGKVFLMVGTKKQAQDIVQTEASSIGMPYVSEKWLGGMLTNFGTIRKSVKRLDELEAWERDGIFRVLSKKKVSRLNKEMNRLRRVLTGIRTMEKHPDAVFIIDPSEEEMAVAEARKLGIPIVAVCDTNCDPDLIDHPIPGNDDAARAIKLFCGVMADAIRKGREEYEAAKAKATVEGAEAEMAAAAAAEGEVPAEGQVAVAPEAAAPEAAAPPAEQPAPAPEAAPPAAQPAPTQEEAAQKTVAEDAAQADTRADENGGAPAPEAQAAPETDAAKAA